MHRQIQSLAANEKAGELLFEAQSQRQSQSWIPVQSLCRNVSMGTFRDIPTSIVRLSVLGGARLAVTQRRRFLPASGLSGNQTALLGFCSLWKAAELAYLCRLSTLAPAEKFINGQEIAAFPGTEWPFFGRRGLMELCSRLPAKCDANASSVSRAKRVFFPSVGSLTQRLTGPLTSADFITEAEACGPSLRTGPGFRNLLCSTGVI